MERYCYLRNIQDLTSDGKTPNERRFGMPFNGQVTLEQWSNLDCISLEQKSCQVYFSVMHYTRRESGKETLWSQTLKNWRKWTHQNSTPEGSMQREAKRRKEVETSYSQSQMEQSKIFRGEQRLRTSTLTRDRPERGEEQEILQGKSHELHFPSLLQEDSTRDDKEANSDFWTITREIIYRHHVEPRVKLYMPREESFPIPLKYIDVTRTRHTNLTYCWKNKLKITETWMEKHNCQMHGQGSQGSFL